MPSAPLTFRAMCGQFVSIFLNFMSKLLKFKAAIATLKVSTCLDGATFGLLLSLFCFGNLLLLCGDVEMNPGPPKNNSRQTRLTSELRTKRVDSDSTQQPESSASAQSTTGQPTLRDLMDLVCSINSSWSTPSESSKPEDKSQLETTAPSTNAHSTEKSSPEDLMSLLNDMNRKFDDMKVNLMQLTNMCAKIQDEMSSLKREMNNIKHDQEELKKENSILKDKVEVFERRMDYLETQSKRNNVLFHGVFKKENESDSDCEHVVRKILTDKLQLTEDMKFDQIRRLNSKANSPIVARFTHRYQRETVFRVKHKLKGSEIFISPDLPVRIRDIRRGLLPFLKEAKEMKKKAFLVHDHLIIDGKKHYLDQNGLKIYE